MNPERFRMWILMALVGGITQASQFSIGINDDTIIRSRVLRRAIHLASSGPTSHCYNKQYIHTDAYVCVCTLEYYLSEGIRRL